MVYSRKHTQRDFTQVPKHPLPPAPHEAKSAPRLRGTLDETKQVPDLRLLLDHLRRRGLGGGNLGLLEPHGLGNPLEREKPERVDRALLPPAGDDPWPVLRGSK